MKTYFRTILASGLLLTSAAAAELVVGQKVSGTVGFYSSGRNQLAEIPVGNHPHELAFSPGRRYLYVSDNGILWMTEPGEGGNTISIIDVVKRAKTGVIDLGKYRRPHGIDVDARTGNLAVTVENPDGLVLVDPKSRKVLRYYDTKGKSPHMVKLDPKAEYAYVSNTGSSTVAAVRLASGEVTLIPTDARPQGAVFALDGKLLYVTNSDGNSISVIDCSVKKRVGTIRTGRGPGRIAITPNGALLVYNLQAGEAVGFADPKNLKQVGEVRLSGPPLSLHLSWDGQMGYLGIQSQDKVVAVSVPHRKIVREIPTKKGAGPDAVMEIEQ